MTLANAAAGQTGTDVLQPNEDTYVSPAATTLTITIDLLAASSNGCIALAGENLNGVLMELRGSTDNFGSSNVVLSASAALSGFTAAWRAYTPASYRYLRITLTGATTATRIYHAAVAPLQLLPYLEDGADLDAFQSSTNHIISPQGHFLGSQKSKTERKIPLSWGQVTDTEYQLFVAWATACVRTPQAFFFVPDSAISTCYFGYTDQGYTFSAPSKNGLHALSKIPFTARYA